MAVEENKNKKIGLIVSVGAHLLLLLLFFFMLAWKEPDPPLPEYGIELNFGMDNTGSGETQRPQPTRVVEEQPEEEVAEPEPEEVEEVKETPQPVIEEVVEELEVEEPPTEVQPEESPVEVKKVEEPQPQAIAEPKEEVKPKEVTETPKEKAVAANQGDNVDKPGDKGKEEGEIDARAIYGAKGAEKGASLQMTGWNWDFIPRPDDKSAEDGRIVFQVTIDDEGYVIRVTTLEKTVSPAVERIYREEVEKLTFSRTADNLRPAPTSTGKISFVIKSR